MIKIKKNVQIHRQLNFIIFFANNNWILMPAILIKPNLSLLTFSSWQRRVCNQKPTCCHVVLNLNHSFLHFGSDYFQYVWRWHVIRRNHYYRWYYFPHTLFSQLGLFWEHYACNNYDVPGVPAKIRALSSCSHAAWMTTKICFFQAAHSSCKSSRRVEAATNDRPDIPKAHKYSREAKGRSVRTVIKQVYGV